MIVTLCKLSNSGNDVEEQFEVEYVTITPQIIRLHLDANQERTFFRRENGGEFWFEFETLAFVKDISICQK